MALQETTPTWAKSGYLPHPLRTILLKEKLKEIVSLANTSGDIKHQKVAVSKLREAADASLISIFDDQEIRSMSVPVPRGWKQ